MPLQEVSLYSELLVLGVMAPMLRPGRVGTVGRRGLTGGAVLLTAGWLALELVLPFPSLSRLFFPILDLTRMVELGEFIQRVEAAFVFVWVFTAGMMLSATVMSAALTLADTAELPDCRPLLWPVALLVFTVAFIPFDVWQAANLDSLTLRPWSWPVSFGLPALTLAMAALTGKRGAPSEQASH